MLFTPLGFGFGTIRNNTALKLTADKVLMDQGFGTIRNNTALKLSEWHPCSLEVFWNHSKQHSSKTRLEGTF